METRKLIIIGSGPAGLTAAIYAARAELQPMLLAGSAWGGQLMLTTDVGNYPGFVEDIQGPDLMNRMLEQAKRFGAEVVLDDVTRVDLQGAVKKVYTHDKAYESQAVIIATGASTKWLGIPSEERLRGRGVSSCATCLPPGANIVVNSSPRPIEQIEEGQKVLTHNGTFQQVVGRGHRHFQGHLVKITPRYFRDEPTLLTPEHPVLATTLTRGTGPYYWRIKWGYPGWVAAGSLSKEHILLYPVVQGIKDVKSIHISELLNLSTDSSGDVHFERETYTARRLPDEIPVDNDFMRLAGYFLAEGSITSRGINFYFGPGDQEYVADVTQVIKKLFNYDVRVKKDGSVFRIECYAGILRDLFENLFGKYSYGKSIPHWFVYLPFKKQAEFIKGYWRGDGGIKKLGFVLVTNSPKLVTQFKMILLRLGIIPQILKQTKESLNKGINIFKGRKIEFKHDRYQLMLGGQWLEKASKVLGVDHPLLKRRTRYNEHGWIKDGYAYLPIAKLEKEEYDGLVYNIAVEGQNSYVTAGAAVHNCDGFFFKDKRLAVIGGGDTAMEEALFLTKFASEVTVVHRRDTLRASKIMQKRAFANPKIKFIWDSGVEEILGQEAVTGVKLKNLKTQELKNLEVEGVFVAIGHEPNTKFLADSGVELDEKGYVKLHDGSRTNLEGVFVSGDVHDHIYRQAVTAAGAGCKAAMDAERWLSLRTTN